MTVGENGQAIENPVRTSYGTFMTGSLAEDDVVQALERRIAEWSHIPQENGEAFYLLRYENGQEYKPHMDWFALNADAPYWIGRSGQRMATVLTYLADVEEGGETIFPRLGLEIKPRKGDAILWYNTNLEGKTEDFTLHGSKPVISGTKWAMTKWLRERKA
eukprot:TRINITY_DN834_c0_g1_i1.p1 TRINITY_DN834_c0_g1~~TRINITY_DN834_c0_g1_i1.p1  ORF type:complete len:161 (-),score=45.82 TRINITY_DN834_c0_g1_i1:74-556(-)